VSLLGDACHPMLPSLGQGAMMAIEDGFVLARCFEQYSGDVGTALARYEDARRDRTHRVVTGFGGERQALSQSGARQSRRRAGLRRSRVERGAHQATLRVAVYYDVTSVAC